MQAGRDLITRIEAGRLETYKHLNLTAIWDKIWMLNHRIQIATLPSKLSWILKGNRSGYPDLLVGITILNHRIVAALFWLEGIKIKLIITEEV